MPERLEERRRQKERARRSQSGISRPKHTDEADKTIRHPRMLTRVADVWSVSLEMMNHTELWKSAESHTVTES